MPECYTHVHIATQALMRSGNTVASLPAFIAGANGPDPLFNFQLWKRRRKPNLPALAARMHHEKTGDFLLALIRGATTPAQQSYVLGFITHYTTDCTLYPYIAAMSAPSQPYKEHDGRYLLAASIDAELHYRHYKTRLVALNAGTPVLITDELAQVCHLLREAIDAVYGYDVSLLALADAFHDNRSIRRLLLSKTGAKRFLYRLAQPAKASKYGGPLAARMQPAAPLRRLPQLWVNPYSGEEANLTFDEVLAVAEQTGAVCVTAAMHSWLGSLSDEKLAVILGSNDYYTGLPCKAAVEQPEPALAQQQAQPETA